MTLSLGELRYGKRIDTVVVYKVDRLTRSLMDFARIVEQFDKQGISFVSVPQQFNTTTSMGRLTLNVLLSFAQFASRQFPGVYARLRIVADRGLVSSSVRHALLSLWLLRLCGSIEGILMR
jgi:hypothetical protein